MREQTCCCLQNNSGELALAGAEWLFRASPKGPSSLFLPEDAAVFAARQQQIQGIDYGCSCPGK